ncbi:RNA-binding protein 34 [Polypterus senegalus]|uniref:RNA-binding protein 34 n=1 Tax=Polypterus senegalus TaxID=55291 RepID=UPI001963F8B2|nr:RNA-binding protein 34 [Polypterus senegalus]
MKKKQSLKRKACNVPEQQSTSDDYVVGQVAGCLFTNTCASSTGSLASLFKTESTPAKPVYITASKVSPEKRPRTEDVTASNVAQSSCSVKKQKKLKEQIVTLGEQKVLDRERSLKTAEEEKGKLPLSKTKKKSKASPSEASFEDFQYERKKKKINWAEERLKNKRTVFVGNLPVSCNEKTLRSLFKEYGSIESMRFRSVVRGEKKMSKKVATIKRIVHPNATSINAYIVFKSETEAVKALQKNGNEIEHGYHIKVDLASRCDSHDHKKSIFVGNLAYDVKDEELREHFLECGEIEGIRLIKDRNTGLVKGFGYILFKTPDSVQLALKLNSSELKGRKLRVQRSVKKQKQNKNTLAIQTKHTGKKTAPKATAKVSSKGRSGKYFKENAHPAFVGEMATDGVRNKSKGPKKAFRKKDRKRK